ncbi:MAG TPA: YqgE/AlgH family protein [Bacteroidia bacterium]|nr:YqgE/AlgH family protein [Bacteroidia bacterium]
MLFPANKIKPAQGRLLVSEPFLHDDYFRRSVLLIAEHNEKGTVGFILNKPLDVTLQEAVPGFPEFSGTAFFGGPVQRDQLYYVHTLGNVIPDSVQISPGLWWLGDFDKVKEMMRRKEIGEKEIRFFIGYAGWEEGQLSRELGERSWYVSRGDREVVFSDAHETLWTETVKSMGSEYSLIVNYPEDPSMN